MIRMPISQVRVQRFGQSSRSRRSAAFHTALTRCLEGLFAQRVNLPVRMRAGVPGDPGVTVSSRR
jgi:hypothetical protein